MAQFSLPRPISDNLPILVDSGGIQQRSTPFRFENLWLIVEGFREKVGEMVEKGSGSNVRCGWGEWSSLYVSLLYGVGALEGYHEWVGGFCESLIWRLAMVEELSFGSMCGAGKRG